jgi:hypothetical protein
MPSLSNVTTARVYLTRHFLRTLPALLALLPLAYIVRLCVLFTVDVPFLDEWEMVPRLDHWWSGTLTIADFWGQHNEQRPLFPVATMLLLARVTGWSAGWEVALNIVLGAGIFGVFAAYLLTAWRDHGGAPLWLLPVISVLLFSPVQWENWTWGWEIIAFMSVLASVLGAYLVASGARRRGAFASALACGVVTTYSWGSGLLYWVAQPPGVWFGGGARRAFRLAVWTVVAAVTIATYFYDFHRPPMPSMLSNFTSFAAVRQLVLYWLTYLGAPIAWTSQPQAIAMGAVAVATFTALAIHLRHRRAEAVFLFPFTVGLQVLGTAAVTALSRAWMGADQALSSRYTTVTLPLWCAIVCLLALWRSAARHGTPALVRTLVTAALLVTIMAGAVRSGRDGLTFMIGRSEALRFARRGLITGRSDALLLMLYPNLAAIRERRATLLRLHLSVFRPSARPTYPIPGPP